MNDAKNYNLAVALLQFKTAYKNLVNASKELPDLDVSEDYPFFILDFEDIEPAVTQWCTIHASRLMQNLPDKVDNPACLACAYYRIGVGANGQCRGLTSIWCGIFPAIGFSREAVTPTLLKYGVDTSKLSDNDLHLLYIKRADEIYAQKKASAHMPVDPGNNTGGPVNYDTPGTEECGLTGDPVIHTNGQ